MPRWEVCAIYEIQVQEGGWGKKEIWAYQAHRFEPSGGTAMILEVRCEERGNKPAEQTLVAKLGQDGWEPMPLRDSHITLWYFKRQL
jgi:hypothetical protein